MHDVLGLHKCRLAKREDEDEIEDDFFLSKKYSDQWGVLMDKEYQGASDVLRALTSKNKPVCDILSRKEDYNKKLSSYRMLVENFPWTLKFAVVRVFCNVCLV